MSHKQSKKDRKEQRMGSNNSSNGNVPGETPIVGQTQPGYQVSIQFNMQGIVVGVFGPQGMTLPALMNHMLAGAQALSIEMLKKEQKEKSRIIVPEFGGVVPFKKN